MNRILTCPHCGPTLTEARLRCDRCGRELLYVSETEFVGREGKGGDPARKPGIGRRVWLWSAVAASVVIVVAMAGLTTPGRGTPTTASPDPSVAMPGTPPSAPSTAALADVQGTADETPRINGSGAQHKPGDLEEALEQYRAALAEAPADPELMANVGQLLVAMDKPGEGVPFLEQALAAEPFSVVTRFDLAVAYARTGKLAEAVEQYEALVRGGSTDARVFHNLGLALRQLGRNAEAASAFARATSAAPERAPGWLGLALSLESDGRGAEAAAALERYLSLEPSGPDTDNVRARIARLRAAAEPSEALPDPGTATPRRCP